MKKGRRKPVSSRIYGRLKRTPRDAFAIKRYCMLHRTRCAFALIDETSSVFWLNVVDGEIPQFEQFLTVLVEGWVHVY